MGYRAAGLDVGYACDLDPPRAETYRINARPGARVEVADVREVRGADLPEVDVLDGSPPCQPFSSAAMGHQRGSADARDMVPEFVRLVLEVGPRAFVMENV